MGITIGTSLGSYEITALLGKGGMGEVYRARDIKLKREVAIKILPEEFSRDADRVSRFQREAEVLASLNHPNIASIHDVQETDGYRFLVMELVEGETLAEHIARGPLPIEEALSIARQIAEALEAAHEKGIVHRDLKPANVKLLPDGKVKVLDFGLAKAMEHTPATTLSNSPTVMGMAATNAGMILGTAAYMSPEQARGLPVDRRADIFAFGCVLYEMLTGRQAFQGETISDILAAVLTSQPDWSRLPADTPPYVRTLLTRCLNKNPQKRLPHIGIARIEIDDVPAIADSLPASRRKTSWIVACGAGLLLGAAVVLLLWSPWRTREPISPLRLSADLGVAATLGEDGANLVLSPNGTLLAFVAQSKPEEPYQLYIRSLDQLQATRLPGTEGAVNPFFSPDGEWIGFFAAGKLKKTSIRGGTPSTVCDALNGRGGDWAEDGTIVFSPNNNPNTRLMRVSSAGGTPEQLTKTKAKDLGLEKFPQVLPGGKAVLFTVQVPSGRRLVAAPLGGGPGLFVLEGATYGRYLSSGHLVFIRDGTLFAVSFDPKRFEMAGTPVPVIEGISSNGAIGSAQFSVSATGTVVFEQGPHDAGVGQTMSWMDHEGKTTLLRSTPADWSNPRFSPDGRRIAMDIWDGKQRDIWIYDWQRDTLSRLTFDPADDTEPMWTADGRRIAFASKRGDGAAYNIYWQFADGTGSVQRLTESKNHQFPFAWHPDGKHLIFDEIITSGVKRDLMVLPMEGNETSGWKAGKPTVFSSTPFYETNPALSPDGSWLAYDSNESGQPEVYVRPFPGPGGKWQISSGGGAYPVWSRTKHELFYGTPGLQIIVAPYSVAGGEFAAEKPRLWSPGHFTQGAFQRYDLHPDGQRFAVSAAPAAQFDSKGKVVFVFNFFEELRRIAPASKK
jgi:serine/threonine-protein kinase